MPPDVTVEVDADDCNSLNPLSSRDADPESSATGELSRLAAVNNAYGLLRLTPLRAASQVVLSLHLPDLFGGFLLETTVFTLVHEGLVVSVRLVTNSSASAEQFVSASRFLYKASFNPFENFVRFS